jgi:hypothetical protein
MSRIVGKNVRTYPREARPGEPNLAGWHPDGCTVTVVLVAGDELVGDYAAYAGAGSPEWVARYGDKIPFEEACVHFPGGQLVRERYRE